eukprot:596850-Pelagomonas_calceolata.AAC.2
MHRVPAELIAVSTGWTGFLTGQSACTRVGLTDAEFPTLYFMEKGSKLSRILLLALQPLAVHVLQVQVTEVRIEGELQETCRSVD